MSETTAGGCYKDATGDGYHNAHGDPVDAPAEPSMVNAALDDLNERLAKEKAEKAKSASLPQALTTEAALRQGVVVTKPTATKRE